MRRILIHVLCVALSGGLAIVVGIASGSAALALGAQPEGACVGAVLLGQVVFWSGSVLSGMLTLYDLISQRGGSREQW